MTQTYNQDGSIEISAQELQKRKLFIATPMYGGQCSGMYTKSCIDLGILLTKYGIEHTFYYLMNESLIPRARNYCADEFLRARGQDGNPYTHLIFIDSDIAFNPEDVISSLVIADPKSDKDIVCGPYPKKCISWEKIVQAVNKGVADRDPGVLENYVGDYVFNPAENTGEVRLDQPLEVLESGTGFMCIQRHVFERFQAKYPELLYTPDHVRTKEFDGSRKITCFFDGVIDPKSNRYLSEDYMFCQYARASGSKTWLLPWMHLKHVGAYVFGGSLPHLAAIDATATADPSKLGKPGLGNKK